MVVVVLWLGSRAELVPTKEATSTCPRCDLKRHSKVVVAAVAALGPDALMYIRAAPPNSPQVARRRFHQAQVAWPWKGPMVVLWLGAN